MPFSGRHEMLRKWRRMVVAAERRHREPAGSRIPREAAHSLTFLLAVSLMVLAVMTVAPAWASMSQRTGAVLDTLGGGAVVLTTIVAGMRFSAVPTGASRALLVALAFSATSILLLAVVPTLVAVSLGSSLNAGTSAAWVFCGALLAWAAFARDSPVEVARTSSRLVARAAATSLAAIAAGAAIDIAWPRLDSSPAQVLHIASQSTLLTLGHGIAAALLAVAALGFALRAPRVAFPHLASWMAISATLASASCLDYLLNPSAQTSSAVSLADLVLTAGTLALAVGAVRELTSARRGEREAVTREFESARRGERDAAVREERKRVARELHDSVVQELAFIVGQSRRLADALPEESALADIGTAAAHALAGSRSVLYGLETVSSRSLAEAIRARAHALASRAGLQLTMDLAEHIKASGEAEHAVMAIVQEAFTNAARHSGATAMGILLAALGDTIVVRITDDGIGFDQVWASPPQQTGRFGLWNIRDRARELGGSLTVDSTPGVGTTIQAIVPAGRSQLRETSPTSARLRASSSRAPASSEHRSCTLVPKNRKWVVRGATEEQNACSSACTRMGLRFRSSWRAEHRSDVTAPRALCRASCGARRAADFSGRPPSRSTRPRRGAHETYCTEVATLLISAVRASSSR